MFFALQVTQHARSATIVDGRFATPKTVAANRHGVRHTVMLVEHAETGNDITAVIIEYFVEKRVLDGSRMIVRRIEIRLNDRPNIAIKLAFQELGKIQHGALGTINDGPAARRNLLQYKNICQMSARSA